MNNEEWKSRSEWRRTEKVCPWCGHGQPSDRGRLKNRTEQNELNSKQSIEVTNNLQETVYNLDLRSMRCTYVWHICKYMYMHNYIVFQKTFWDNANNHKCVWIMLSKELFWISQGKVATSHMWGGQVIRCLCQIFSQDWTHRSSLKWVDFWQSY